MVLVIALRDMPETRVFLLEKQVGQTIVHGQEALGWKWPGR